VGIAGGIKYQHQGIFFKFAVQKVDSRIVYGKDELAMKSASHELKVQDKHKKCQL
jgi:hypothetical protein